MQGEYPVSWAPLKEPSQQWLVYLIKTKEATWTSNSCYRDFPAAFAVSALRQEENSVSHALVHAPPRDNKACVLGNSWQATVSSMVGRGYHHTFLTMELNLHVLSDVTTRRNACLDLVLRRDVYSCMHCVSFNHIWVTTRLCCVWSSINGEWICIKVGVTMHNNS